MVNKTATEVKAELERKGMSVTQWSESNDIQPFTVYQLLTGKSKGKRGEAHRAAVLLGLKSEGEIVDPKAARGKLFAATDRHAA